MADSSSDKPLEHTHTAAFRGAFFRSVDLGGATIRDSDLTGVRITASEVRDVRISGWNGQVAGLVVDDVEVTAFVAAELDRRHPERVVLRAASTADELRAAWTLLLDLWSGTLARAEALPEAVRKQRVEGEWSFVETLRHLVFAVDCWIGAMLSGEPRHRLALANTDYPEDQLAALGVDPAADPSYDEVRAALESRWTMMSDAVAAVDDAALAELRTGAVAPAWGEETHSVLRCLSTVLLEHGEHRRYAERDLAALEGGLNRPHPP